MRTPNDAELYQIW